MLETDTPNRRALSFCFLLILLAFGFGCQTPGLVSLEHLPETVYADYGEVARRVESRADAVQSLAARARMRVEKDGRRVSYRQVVLLASPSSLRLDVTGAFGQPAAVLATDGRRLVFFDAGSRRYYQGGVSPENLDRFVPLGLGVDVLVALMAAHPPVDLLGGAGHAARYRPRENVYHLVVWDARGEGRYELRADPRTFGLTRVERYGAGGELEFRALYDMPEGGGEPAAVPRIAIEVPGRALKATLEYTSPKVNSPIEADQFRPEPPPGSEIIDLETLGEAPKLF